MLLGKFFTSVSRWNITIDNKRRKGFPILRESTVRTDLRFLSLAQRINSLLRRS
jgi:hypothetical protein